MGDRWVKGRDAAREGTLRAADPEARVIGERWDHFLQYVALGLSQDLGRDVTLLRGRKQNTHERISTLVQQLATAGQLSGSLRVPNAIAPIDVVADLRARQVTTSVRVDAPSEMRQVTRVTWLLRQLADASADLRVEVAFAGSRETTSMRFADAQEKPEKLCHPSDRRREIRSFVVALNRPMGLKRGKGKGSFVGETRQQVHDFYATVVQGLKSWQPRAPQLRSQPEVDVTPGPLMLAAAPLTSATDERAETSESGTVLFESVVEEASREDGAA